MLPFLLLKGSLIGLSLSIPMGPTGILCLRYSIVRGRSFGIASGLGIAFAEASCGALTAVGLATLTGFIEDNHIWLKLIGSLFLFYFGLITIKSSLKKEEKEKSVVQKSYFYVFLTMFILTFTNPLTLLSFVAIFSTLGIDTLENDPIAIGQLAMGVFAGSISWWVMVSSSSSYFLGKIKSSAAKKLNKLSGYLIVIAAVLSFAWTLKFLIL